ncbi:MAG: hypothetical protein NVSMB2_14700 [Chloroflexota bacterium]
MSYRARLPIVLSSLLGAAALATSLAPAAANASSSVTDSLLKVHPSLLRRGQDESAPSVRVIIQRSALDASVSRLLTVVPGLQVVEQFGIIPAFVATLPIGQISTLAAQPEVRSISPDGAVQTVPTTTAPSNSNNGSGAAAGRTASGPVSSGQLVTSYPFSSDVAPAWAGQSGSPATGAGITVAVIDSGLDAGHPDLAGHVQAVNVNASTSSTADGYGHGTHVVGIIDGRSADGKYIGIAPDANVISVKIADDSGQALESDLLRGLEWVDTHRTSSGIKALNLSVQAAIPSSYATSPIDAAVELLINHGITVVAAAGNAGNVSQAEWYAPANDPLVITVGCLDDNASATTGDDSLCSISSRGTTADGFAKPDLVAPGRKIVSTLARGANGTRVALAQDFPDRVTSDGQHIRLSGTSMSAPVVTGAVAVLLQRYPSLTPGQIKNILVESARTYPGQPDKAGALDIQSALTAAATPPTSTTYLPLPLFGPQAPSSDATIVWNGSTWATSYYSGSQWVSGWAPSLLTIIGLQAAHWDGTSWDGAHWDSVSWDGTRWQSAHWDSAHWDSAHWDSAHWDSAHWDSVSWD